ncbi:MAG: carboxypeptidase-like regulatory domain-containing protein [Candidatus Bathyarchaeia archaeon]
MKTIMLLILTSLALPFFMLNVSAPPNETFSGTVYASSGVPVQNAVVTATSNIGFGTATTDLNGHYSITSGLPAGNYTLTVISNGYLEFTVENVSVTVGGTTIENPYMNVSGGVSGRITDASTHIGLNNVTVTVLSSTGSFGWAGLTDILGNYTIVTNLATGNYNVTVLFPKGHISKTLGSISVSEGAITTAHDMALEHSGTISGTVTDTSSVPLANVTVIALSTSMAMGTAKTDASGHYSISDGLANGTYIVTATYPGGFAMPNASVPVVEGQETSNINFVMNILTTSGTIIGKVTDTGSTPIAGALVTAEGQHTSSSESTYTDTSGNYMISTGLQTDTYNVTAFKPGYTPSSQNVSVTVNTVSQANFALTKIPPEQSGTISGTVTGDTNPPVPEYQSPLIILLILTLTAVAITKSSRRKQKLR